MATTLHSTSRSDALPGPDLRIKAGACSVTGPRRDHNEDVAYISPDLHVFIVADGMGGHAAGEVASQFAVDTLSHELATILTEPHSDQEVDSLVRAALDHAHCLIAEMTHEDWKLAGADTTVVLALLFGSRLFVTGVGDSRAYLIRRGNIEQLTTDDSWPQLLLQAGILSREEAKGHSMRNVLLSSLAMEEFKPDKEIRILEVRHDDRVLLCSDGLTNVLDDDVLRDALIAQDNPQQAAEAVVQLAIENDGGDDITCLIFHVEGGANVSDGQPPVESWFGRIWRTWFGRKPLR